MELRRGLVALLIGASALLSAAPAARADHFYDRYRGWGQYYRGRDFREIRQREILRNRLFDLADRVRLAEREGAISRRKANELYRDLDRVRDFLRNDRYLTDSEFERRWDDLNDIARDLRRACGHRHQRFFNGWRWEAGIGYGRVPFGRDRYGRYERPEDQYDRWDGRDRDRYDRDRYDRDRYDRDRHDRDQHDHDRYDDRTGRDRDGRFDRGR